MSVPPYPSTPPPGFVPPEPPVRPKLIDSIAIATELWVVVIVARTVAEFGQLSTLRAVVEEQISSAPKDTAPAVLDAWRGMSSTGFLIGMLVVATLVVGGITLTLMWFARQGHNWARLLLAGASLYVVVSTLWGLFIVGVTPSWVAIPLIVAGVAAGGAVVALMRRDAETWCADMALYRRQSKAFAAMSAFRSGPGWPTPGGADR